MGVRTLTVICPVFREDQVILSFHSALTAALEPLSERYAWQVLYVVDPGGDGTEDVLRGLVLRDPHVRVLVLSRRFGHQAALIAGLDHADADAVVMLDSDMQHPPGLIPELVAAFEQGADVVQALRQDPPGVGRVRQSASRAFYKIVSRLSDLELSAGSADFRLLSRRVVHVFQAGLREQNPFVRGLTQWVGFRVVLVPFEVQERGAGESKYRLTTLVDFAVRGITSFSKAPLRLAATIGFVMSFLSVSYAVFALLAYFGSAYVPPGWTSTLAAVGLVGGIQMFFLGVLSEYVGYVFDEVKARPRYLVSETMSFRTTNGDGELWAQTLPPVIGDRLGSGPRSSEQVPGPTVEVPRRRPVDEAAALHRE